MAKFARRPVRYYQPTLLGVCVLAALVAMRVFFAPEADDAPPAADTFANERYLAVRVVDGDTLIVTPLAASAATGRPPQHRLRLLGIDAPESVKPAHPVEPWGPEASDRLRSLVEGREVRLEFDKRREDQYGRLLAYLHCDDQLVNEVLVREGLARALNYPGDNAAIARRLRAAEQAAQAARLGIWSTPADDADR